MKKNTIVKFRDEDHTYWHGKTQYTSVNKVIANFGFYFDRDFWLVQKAIEDYVDDFWKKFFKSGFNFDDRKPDAEDLIERFGHEIESKGLTIEEIVAEKSDEWDLASTNGTKFHHERENEAYRDGYIINPYDNKKYTIQEKPKIPPNYDNVSNLNFLKDLKDGAYSELLVFSKKHKIAGQGDEVFIETVNETRFADIGDHKTNNKEPKNSKKNGTCYFPLEHLNDNTYVKYQLQVSMYAKFLEMLGFVVRNVGFYHYTNYDVKTKKVFNLNYLGDEIDTMLDWHLYQTKS